MKEISPESIEELLDTEEAVSLSWIAEQFVETSSCSECGHSTIEYENAREEVDFAMALLMDRGKITSTPDWKYRLARRSDDE